jgi:GTP-binding protein
LKHIERTKFLIHLVSADQEDTVQAYGKVRAELAAFGQGLTDKKELVVLSKADLIPEGEREQRRAELAAAAGDHEVILVSTEDEELLKSFSDRLAKLLDA